VVGVFEYDEKYMYILAIEMASPGNQHCAHCIGALSFPIVAGAGNVEVVKLTFEGHL